VFPNVVSQVAAIMPKIMSVARALAPVHPQVAPVGSDIGAIFINTFLVLMNFRLGRNH
jgi:hypothetical protein